MDNSLHASRSTIGVTKAQFKNLAIVEILEGELDELERTNSAGQQALGFFLFCLGSLVSTATSWISLSDPTPTQAAVYAAITAVLALATLWTGMTWNRERKSQSAIFQELRKRIAAAKEVA